MPTKITASYFEHPAMPPFIELMRETYSDLGIKLETVPFPSSRGPIELNRGLVNADIVRPPEFVKNLSNIIVLKPLIYTAEFVLVCNKKVECDLSVLSNPSTKIITTRSVKSLLRSLKIKAQLNNQESLFGILNRLRAERIDYAIYGTTAKLKNEFKQNFNIVTLQTVNLHHVIHRKYSYLVPQLEHALTKKLKTFNPDKVSFY